MNKIMILNGDLHQEEKIICKIKSMSNNCIKFIDDFVDIEEDKYFEWLFNNLNTCDILILNIDFVMNLDKYLLGAIAGYYMNSNNHIFVVGYGNKDKIPILIKNIFFHTAETAEDIAEFIAINLIA